MSDDDATKTEAIGTLPPGHPFDPAKAPPPPPVESTGPTSPGSPEPAPETGPASGGYDNRPPVPTPDNAKGGYGAG